MRASISILAGLVTLLFVGCLQAEQGRTMTIKEVDALVRQELPVGSSRTQVIAFLDARKIEHSDYLEKEQTIYGMIRDTSQGAMVKGSIKIEFHFDEKANLKDYAVREVFTGP